MKMFRYGLGSLLVGFKGIGNRLVTSYLVTLFTTTFDFLN
jgi:hypothetical protein